MAKTTNEKLADAKAAVIKQELQDFKYEIVNRLQRIEDKVSYTNGKIAKAITDIELNKKEIMNNTEDRNKDIKAIVKNCERNHAPAKDWKMMVASSIVAAVVGILAVVMTSSVTQAIH